MFYFNYKHFFCLQVLIIILATLTSTTPIMVKFGTSDGPITPKEVVSPRTYRHVGPPAPVSEVAEDVPNPDVYEPIKPHQYRTKIYAKKPVTSMVLGTPLDIVYTPYIPKSERKSDLNLGVKYTGPHVFERQAYEFEVERLKLAKPHYVKVTKKSLEKMVPEIGIIYSSGVRYYVPQLAYENKQDEDFENSVYDHPDEKRQHRQQKPQ